MNRWTLLLLLALGFGGCGVEEPSEDPKAYLAEGDAAFARGEALVAARDRASGPASSSAADRRADAVAEWARAADAYRNAFRLLDPDPEVASERGLLAFRAARALAKAALAGGDPDWAALRATLAFTWLDQAERLEPALRQVHYERGRLFDSEIRAVADRVRAHGAYARYLALSADVEVLPAGEPVRVTRARARVKALARHLVAPGAIPRESPRDD